MKTKTFNKIIYNNKEIMLKNSIVLRSDGSYKRENDNNFRYGNSNGSYLKMSLYDIYGKEHKVFMHTLILCNFKCDRPSSDMVVDHIDRNKHNNCVENLRWVVKKQNQWNRSCSVEYEGKTLSEVYDNLDNNLNIPYDTFHHRVVNLGWSIDKAISEGIIGRGDKTENREKGYKNRQSELRKWFNLQENPYKISFRTFSARVKRYNFSKKEALETPLYSENVDKNSFNE